MRKYKKIAGLFILFILFSLTIFMPGSCTGTNTPKESTEVPEIPEEASDEVITSEIPADGANDSGDDDYIDYNAIYADVSLYTPDEKYFVDSSFNLADIADTKYSVIKVFETENKIIALTDSGGSGSDKYILADKNNKILTELYYDSITEFTKNCKYLKCLLNLKESDEVITFIDYITDIIDVYTGKVCRRFVNGDISRDIVYGYTSSLPDFLPLSVSANYFVNNETGEYIILGAWTPEEDSGRYSKAEDLKHGYVDTDFNVIIPPVYDSIAPYDKTYEKFVFFTDGKYYLGDKRGRQLSEHKYDALSWYYDSYERDIYRAFRDGKCCVLDADYNEIIPPVYDLMGAFENGCAPVVQGGEAFYIDMTGKRADIKEVIEKFYENGPHTFEDDFFRYQRWYLFETDINTKIRNYLRSAACFENELKFDFTDEYMFMPPSPVSLGQVFPSITEEMLKTELKYRLGVDESYFTEEKIREMRKTASAIVHAGQYNPITGHYQFIAAGYYTRYIFDYIILDVQKISVDTAGQSSVYEAKVVPVVLEQSEMSMAADPPKTYILGADGKTRYYIDEVIPADMLESFEQRFQDEHSHLTPGEIEYIPNYSYYYYLYDIDPNLDTLKEVYEYSPGGYKTLTLKFKITQGGLINFAR